MENIFKHFLFFFAYLTIAYAATDSLQNPDFEIPPTNLTNVTSQKWLLTGANPLPGWSLNGTVWYVASGGNSSFPDSGGHAVQLGQSGKINQTFRPTKNDDVLHYVVTFTLAAQDTDCANNRTALSVTLRDGWHSNTSRVIYLQENLSRDLWESHAFFLGQLGGRDYVQIEIESVDTTSRENTTCWPLVDAFTIKTNHLPRWYDGNLISNGGFEVGPAFVKNSPSGLILSEEEDANDSPLQQWSILGTVRYVDSRHYKVPRGEAAVELLTGGVKEESMNLQRKVTYTLNFTIGDANDSCVADFVVYLQIGSSLYNFTMKSNGSGSSFKHTLKFRVDEELYPSARSAISFYSFEETRTRDGVLCGPVLDDIYLTNSAFMVRNCDIRVLVFSLFVVFVMMFIVV